MDDRQFARAQVGQTSSAKTSLSVEDAVLPKWAERCQLVLDEELVCHGHGEPQEDSIRLGIHLS